MANLTTKELTALEDQLGVEQVLIKKYTAMSGQCTDPIIKNKLSAIAGRHQQHYNTLMTHLQ
ncbi:MAG: spore coat protein [Oscillospiraceae bacterium]|nr:spore coat protein [Oscillospiraceae bacterium]